MIRKIGATYKLKQDGEIEIKEQATPNVRLGRWGESWLEIDGASMGGTFEQVDDNTLKWSNADTEVQLYPLTAKAGMEHGGFEFEIVLKAKPLSNKLSFSLQTDGLTFLYQPALKNKNRDGSTWEEKNGLTYRRPANVVNSYAVYHATKRNHVTGQTNYMAGKAYHIPCPQIFDADGKWVWGVLDIAVHTLTIEIPQGFLNTAKYPLRVDPTFGKTDVGGSTGGLGGDYKSAAKYNMPVSGNVSKITAYTHAVSGTTNIKGMIYSDNSGAPDALQSPVSGAVNVNTTPAWEEFSFSPPIALSSGDWWLGQILDNDATGYFDAGGTNQQAYNADTYSDNPADPFGSPTYADNAVSVYATYVTIPILMHHYMKLRVN